MQPFEELDRVGWWHQTRHTDASAMTHLMSSVGQVASLTCCAVRMQSSSLLLWDKNSIAEHQL